MIKIIGLLFGIILLQGCGGSSSPSENTPPTSSARVSPATVASGATFTLIGFGSDAEGQALTYLWTQTAGSTATLSNAIASITVATAPSVSTTETLTFQFAVSDGQTTVVKTINVQLLAAPANTPPTSTATISSTTVASGSTFTLTGSGTDAEGQTLTYLWTQTAGTTATLSNAIASITVATAPSVSTTETLTFQFAVSDGQTTVVKTISVQLLAAPANTPPTSTATISSTTVASGSTFTLTGSGTDAEGQTLTYLWTQTAGSTATLSNATASIAVATAPSVNATETLTFQLAVSDGQTTVVKTVSIRLLPQPAPPNTPPTSTARVSPTSVASGSVFTLTGSGIDAEGQPLSYLWTQTAGSTATLANATATVTMATAPSVSATETLTFQFAVSDGQSTVVKTVSVSLLPASAPPNTPPTSTATISSTTIASGSTFTLTGSGSDAEGQTLTYLWTQTAGATATLSNATAPITTATAPSVSATETLTFQFAVSDGQTTVVKTVSVRLLPQPAPPNTPPTSTATISSATVASGATFTLIGSGSDAEGQPLAYLWTQPAGTPAIITNAQSSVTTVTAPILNSSTQLTFHLAVSDGQTTTNSSVTVTVLAVVSQAVSMAALGELIFHDVNLSRDRNQSCATCHDPGHAFIDTRTNTVLKAASVGQDGVVLGTRNSPSINYANRIPTFSLVRGNPVGGQFLDGRASTLSAQAGGPFINAVEMQLENRAAVITRIMQNSTYVASFTALFGSAIFSSTTLAYSALEQSVATFEQLSTQFATFDSKYDRSIRGQATLTASEIRGRNLFFNRQQTNCVTCHALSNTVNTANELFSDFNYENIGVPANTVLNAARMANGQGVVIDQGVLNNPAVTAGNQAGRFKTPSLRNVSVTAPYMHNGVFQNLRTVLEFYDFRANARRRPNNPETGIPWRPPEVNQNLANLNMPQLTNTEINDLIAFFNTLTDQRYESLIPSSQ